MMPPQRSWKVTVGSGAEPLGATAKVLVVYRPSRHAPPTHAQRGCAVQLSIPMRAEQPGSGA